MGQRFVDFLGFSVQEAEPQTSPLAPPSDETDRTAAPQPSKDSTPNNTDNSTWLGAVTESVVGYFTSQSEGGDESPDAVAEPIYRYDNAVAEPANHK